LAIGSSGGSSFEFEIFNHFLINHYNTLLIITMSALNKNLVFTQCVLEKMEATLSIGLLEREATLQWQRGWWLAWYVTVFFSYFFVC
jgi:hypothetical protein